MQRFRSTRSNNIENQDSNIPNSSQMVTSQGQSQAMTIESAQKMISAAQGQITIAKILQKSTLEKLVSPAFKAVIATVALYFTRNKEKAETIEIFGMKINKTVTILGAATLILGLIYEWTLPYVFEHLIKDPATQVFFTNVITPLGMGVGLLGVSYFAGLDTPLIQAAAIGGVSSFGADALYGDYIRPFVATKV